MAKERAWCVGKGGRDGRVKGGWGGWVLGCVTQRAVWVLREGECG